MEQEALLQGPAEVRIVEIGDAGHAVSLVHGEIVITGDEGAVQRISILEIAGMVAGRPGLSFSGTALAALSERAAGIVVCDANYRSRMLSWSMSGRRWPGRIRAQMALGAPFGRHLLRSLTRAHDAQRTAVIEAMGKGRALKALRKAAQPAIAASRMSRLRQQADIEGQIDRHYWPWLAGPGFRRDPARADGNAVVNFAHTMLRIETVRAAHLAGLHPAIGLGGIRGGGGLIDDLMLPYRPVVDLAAAMLVATGQRRMDDASRAALTRLFTAPMRSRRGVMQLRMGLEELARSLGQCIETGSPRLDIRLPAIQDPSAIYDQMTEVRGQMSESEEGAPTSNI